MTGGQERSASPILRELSGSFSGGPSLVDSCDDAELYGRISMAVSCLYGPTGEDLVGEHERAAVQERLVQRLQQGWFGETALTSPQSRYAVDLPGLGVATLEADEHNPAVAAKPRHAVWTGSLLPDGTSSLDTIRSPVPDKQSKKLFLLEFDPAEVRVRLIDEPEDWRRLVNEYPVRCTDGTIGVSWRAVSADYDVVRLSARGLVHCQGVAMRVASGITTMQGWDAESSAWFRFPPGTTISPVR